MPLGVPLSLVAPLPPQPKQKNAEMKARAQAGAKARERGFEIAVGRKWSAKANAAIAIRITVVRPGHWMRGRAGGKRAAEAAVVIETVIGTLVPFGVTEDGEAVQMDSAGAPEHASVTAELNPSMGVTSRL